MGAAIGGLGFSRALGFAGFLKDVCGRFFPV